MPPRSRRRGHPYRRLFVRRLLAGAAIAVLTTVVTPLATPRSVASEQVAGIATAQIDRADPKLSSEPGGVAGPPRGDPPAVQDRGRADRLPYADRPTAPSPAALVGYRWPLPKGRLTLPFGPTPRGTTLVDGKPFHDGIDLATFCGDRIVAAHGGRVLAAGRRYDDVIGWRGDLRPYRAWLRAKAYERSLPITIVIDDGNGYRSIYAHFSRTVVRVGQQVQAGQLIGFEGATGHATGCHVHYSLFSPRERATIGIRGDVRRRMHLPAEKTARIDPLRVLPPRPGDPAPLTP